MPMAVLTGATKSAVARLPLRRPKPQAGPLSSLSGAPASTLVRRCRARSDRRAAQRWPRQRDVQLALATRYSDAGHRDAARNVAKRYADAFPDDTQVQALVRSLN